MKNNLLLWTVSSFVVGYVAGLLTVRHRAGFSERAPSFVTSDAPANYDIDGYLEVINTADGLSYKRILNAYFERFWEEGLEIAPGSIDTKPYEGKYCQWKGYISYSDPKKIKVSDVMVISDRFYLIGRIEPNDKTKNIPFGCNVDWQIIDRMGMAHYLIVHPANASDALKAGNTYKAFGKFVPWGHKSLGTAFDCALIEEQ